MSWKDELLWADSTNQLRKKASFRNAFFFVADSDAGFGRRNIIHQFPNNNRPFIEDLGRNVNTFLIKGYVIGNSDNDQNYFTERNALIQALAEEGSGQLYHPFLGVWTVSLIEEVRMRETFREGGIARFDMNFIEDPGIKATETTPGNSIGSVDIAVVAAIADGIDGFGGIYGQ